MTTTNTKTQNGKNELNINKGDIIRLVTAKNLGGFEHASEITKGEVVRSHTNGFSVKHTITKDDGRGYAPWYGGEQKEITEDFNNDQVMSMHKYAG